MFIYAQSYIYIYLMDKNDFISFKNFKQTTENVFANKQAIELIESQSKIFSLS